MLIQYSAIDICVEKYRRMMWDIDGRGLKSCQMVSLVVAVRNQKII
jgi:hypothetical protein